MKYRVIIAASCWIVKDGFTNWESAYQWALNHDYGQYGSRLVVTSYKGRAK